MKLVQHDYGEKWSAYKHDQYHIPQKNLPKKIIKKVNRYLQQIVTAIIKQVSTVTLPHYSIFEFSGDLSPSLASW